MEKWTIQQMNNYSSLEFAKAMVHERYVPLNHSSPLATKLSKTEFDLKCLIDEEYISGDSFPLNKLKPSQLIKKEADLYIRCVETSIELGKNCFNEGKEKKEMDAAFNRFNECKEEMKKRNIPVPERFITPDIIIKIANEG